MIRKITRTRRSTDHINWGQATIFVGFVSAIFALAVQVIDVIDDHKLGQLQARISHLETRTCK